MRALVVVALRMQRAVHQQVHVVRFERLALLARLAGHHRCAQHQVGQHPRRMLVVEGEHVGRVVLAAVVPVQRTAFHVADDAYRDLRRRFERRAQPACDSVTRQQQTVRPIGELQRQLQRLARQGRHGRGGSLRAAS